jgi:hypothetical protein
MLKQQIIELINNINSTIIYDIALDNSGDIILSKLYAKEYNLPYNIDLYKTKLLLVQTKNICKLCHRKAAYINNSNDYLCWIHSQC